MSNRSSLVLTSSRGFAVPRERLFRAFTDAARLPLWWGPRGFSNTFAVFEPWTGGRWRYTMHGPDGTDYPNDRDFLEVTAPERIVMRNPGPEHGFLMTMTYEETGPETCRLTWVIDFADGPGTEPLRDFILNANEENFDRLEAILARPPEG
jgi:uncharacterized protein YndB with AHSA1/START domain